MFYHPDTVLMLANEHRRDLIAEADRFRLLKAAVRQRRENAQHELKHGNGLRDRGSSPRESGSGPREHRGGPPEQAAKAGAGNLAACGPREAAPAR